jgi:hypothetical protein
MGTVAPPLSRLSTRRATTLLGGCFHSLQFLAKGLRPWALKL